jgi:hypothetical protein
MVGGYPYKTPFFENKGLKQYKDVKLFNAYKRDLQGLYG